MFGEEGDGSGKSMSGWIRPRLGWNVSFWKLLLVILVLYVMVMDVILYTTLQSTTMLLDKALVQNRTSYGVFFPLTTKLLTCNTLGHYITNPSVSIFMKVTHFKDVFFFITPNMISIFHLIIGVSSGFVVTSDRLRIRRLGVVLFEFHRWLDGLDGAVARARSGQNFHHSSDDLGHVLDVVCDIAGSTALCVGSAYYLVKHFNKKQLDLQPVWRKNPAQLTGEVIPSTVTVYWKLTCYGLLIGLASWCWEFIYKRMEDLFEVALPDPHQTEIQTELLHSAFTWWVIYFWRLTQGCNLIHFIAFAIFADKVWELVRLVQYVGHLVILVAFLISYCYVDHMKFLLTS